MGTERNIVVFGGTGQLGRALVAELERRQRPFVAPKREDVDLVAAGLTPSVLSVLAPSAVINASAYTDVGGAELEENHDQVYRLNRDAPAELAAACQATGVPLVHVSTDYVFDGRKREPYREDDPVSPLQVYGRSKLEGERAVLEAHDGALVARTSTLYGPGTRARRHYVDEILHRARKAGRLELVRTPVSSPTYAGDLAVGLLDLLDVAARGLVHVVNQGECSRWDLALEALRLAGLEGKVAVRERPEPPGGLRRPAYSVLDTSRFTTLTGRPMPDWKAALGTYLEPASS